MNIEDFENLTFNTFDKKNDPNSNFFNTLGFINTNYFTAKTLKILIKENNDISFSVLYLNIKSLNKNFESLKNLLVEIIFCFKVICISESWCSDDLHTNNRSQLSKLKYSSSQEKWQNRRWYHKFYSQGIDL